MVKYLILFFCNGDTGRIHLLKSGTDLCYIQELLGHSSIRTTERYAHVAKRRTLAITSPLDTIDKEE